MWDVIVVIRTASRVGGRNKARLPSSLGPLSLARRPTYSRVSVLARDARQGLRHWNQANHRFRRTNQRTVIVESRPPGPMIETVRRKCRNGLPERWQPWSGHRLIGRCCDRSFILQAPSPELCPRMFHRPELACAVGRPRTRSWWVRGLLGGGPGAPLLPRDLLSRSSSFPRI